MAVKVESLCSIWATVPTGLEKGAADECKELLGRGDVLSERGKVSFPLYSLNELSKVDKLRSIENFAVLVKDLPNFCKEDATVLERLVNLPLDTTIDWTTPLSVWQHYRLLFSNDHECNSTHELNLSHIDQNTAKTSPTKIEKSSKNDTHITTAPEAQGDSQQCSIQASQFEKPSLSRNKIESIPKGDAVSFRVTCVRGGRKHSFSSMEAAGRLGAGLVKQYGWKVQMKNADIEVLLNIQGDAAKIHIALSRESKSKRNINHFGPTTLKAAIAYGLLRLADIQAGEIVLDPMCGGGSISIEGSLAWPATFQLSGDLHDQAIPRAMANLNDLRASGAGGGLKVDVLQWDVRNLPLRTASVDVVVTDLPFGKKSGRKVDNWELYPSALEELGRVCKPTTARAILLTHDNKALSKALLRTHFWRRHLTKWINIGGLTAAVYILHRTGTL